MTDCLWVSGKKESWRDELREPAPTWEELWTRTVVEVPAERWKKSHRPMDVGNDGEKRKWINV